MKLVFPSSQCFAGASDAWRLVIWVSPSCCAGKKLPAWLQGPLGALQSVIRPDKNSGAAVADPGWVLGSQNYRGGHTPTL